MIKLDWPLPEQLVNLCETIHHNGGTAYIVGGAVRDQILKIHQYNIVQQDYDIEVHGIDISLLESILSKFGSLKRVGVQFGILILTFNDAPELTIDVAIPRTENRIGVGHRDFEVSLDAHMGLSQAVKRRDFTINSLMYDPLTKEVHDPTTQGLDDLERRTLRHVSEAFREDPLRVYRALQFMSRFELEVATETMGIMREMIPELSALAKERIFSEWRKLLLSPKPSIGLELLKELDFLNNYSELSALVGVEQEPEWHPEGDVWIHTMMVVDAAARIAMTQELPEDEHLILVIAALCHDFGKPKMTHFDRGRWRSPNHEKAGVEPTQTFLKTIGMPARIADAIPSLVAEHLKPYQLYAERDKISDSAIRRLASRVNIERLVRVAKADYLGRTTYEALNVPDPVGPWLLAEAERLKVKDAAPKPLVLGRHLIEQGLKPGPELGRTLKQLFEAQLDGEFDSVEGGLVYFKELFN